MSVTSDGGAFARRHFASPSLRLDDAQERVDLAAVEFPVLVEIGDDLLHERLRHSDRPLLVAEVIEQHRERELLRAIALVGPFEAVAGKALDVVVLIEALAVDRDDETVDGAPSLICAHGIPHDIRPQLTPTRSPA